MTSIATMIRSMRGYQAILARSTFLSAGSVSIRSFHDLDRASSWCEERWLEHGQRYRRTVYVADEKATFQFEDRNDVLAFRITFG
ncbi:MAG: hypothetical protein M3Q08_10245 [Pseudomonadota bacterium]|nr:hypothetical protein [Pseudomonadota bacterium]